MVGSRADTLAPVFLKDGQDICSTVSAGAEWTCSRLPFVNFAPGRMASMAATRWLVLTVVDKPEVVIATSTDGGARWTVRTAVRMG